MAENNCKTTMIVIMTALILLVTIAKTKLRIIIIILLIPTNCYRRGYNLLNNYKFAIIIIIIITNEGNTEK